MYGKSYILGIKSELSMQFSKFSLQREFLWLEPSLNWPLAHMLLACKIVFEKDTHGQR
jgi:hypothetical protein